MLTRAKGVAANNGQRHAPEAYVRDEKRNVPPSEEAVFTENIHRREYIIPTVFRAMVILKILNARNRGATVAEIREETRFARTTIYRILRTLSFASMVRQDIDGKYWACTLPSCDPLAPHNTAPKER